MSTEVFNRIGESEIHSENPNFHKRTWEENDGFEESDESSKTIESQSKPLVEAKKEFLEHLEDDSLTVDTCGNLNKDWKKK